MRISYGLTALLVLSMSACAATKENQLLQYSERIKVLSCQDLGVEERFLNKKIEKLETANQESHVAGDIAATFLTLGTNTMNEGASTSRNYRKRMEFYETQLQSIKQQQNGRCV